MNAEDTRAFFSELNSSMAAILEEVEDASKDDLNVVMAQFLSFPEPLIRKCIAWSAGKPVFQQAWASNQLVRIELLDSLFDSRDEEVRAKLAARVNLSPEQYHRLYLNGGWKVFAVLAANPFCPLPVLNELTLIDTPEEDEYLLNLLRFQVKKIGADRVNYILFYKEVPYQTKIKLHRIAIEFNLGKTQQLLLSNLTDDDALIHITVSGLITRDDLSRIVPVAKWPPRFSTFAKRQKLEEVFQKALARSFDNSSHARKAFDSQFIDTWQQLPYEQRFNPEVLDKQWTLINAYVPKDADANKQDDKQSAASSAGETEDNSWLARLKKGALFKAYEAKYSTKDAADNSLNREAPASGVLQKTVDPRRQGANAPGPSPSPAPPGRRQTEMPPSRYSDPGADPYPRRHPQRGYDEAPSPLRSQAFPEDSGRPPPVRSQSFPEDSGSPPSRAYSRETIRPPPPSNSSIISDDDDDDEQPIR